MTHGPAQRVRRAMGLCAVAAMLAGGAPVRAQPAADAAPPPVYEDRLIGGGTLAPDISTGDAYSSDTSGLARSVRVDAVASVLTQSGANAAPTAHENGVIADAQWETSSYGTWSANGAVRIGGSSELVTGGSGGEQGSFTLHQRGMPFDGGWQADNGLGDLNAPLIDLERQQPRFVLSSGALLGAETEWRGPGGVEIVAGGGEPGLYNGIKVPVFQTLGGSTATLGAQWSPAPQWSVGGEYAGARDANVYYQPPGATLLPPDVANTRISSDTGILSAAWQQGTTRAQVNVIDGTLDGNSNAFGAWSDVAYSHGGYTQNFGAFRIDPNLAWGNQLINSDIEGGYYRVGYQSRRWVADVGVDEARSVSGTGVNSTFLNGDGRYQLSRDTGIGGVANVLFSSDGGSQHAWSVEGYLDDKNHWGLGRVQLSYATASQGDDVSATVQQDWTLGTGVRLATSAGLDRIATNSAALAPSQSSTVVRLAAYGGGDLSARLSLDGNVQWATAVQGRAAPSTSADVSLTYEIARSWEVLFTYYENHIGSWTPLVVQSPLTPPVPTPQSSQGQQGFFLTLRFRDARGSHFVPLGGMPGSGSGRLSGVIYLDANENGRYDAGETGAPNITVILDGRYSTRTDANGRFDFPAVAAGHHVLTVQGDNLALPWALVNGGRTEVDVSTRDRAQVDIGAVRMK